MEGCEFIQKGHRVGQMASGTKGAIPSFFKKEAVSRNYSLLVGKLRVHLRGNHEG